MLWALQDVGEETCNLVDRNTIEEKGEKERRTVVRSYTMSKLKLGSFTLLFRRARNYSGKTTTVFGSETEFTILDCQNPEFRILET